MKRIINISVTLFFISYIIFFIYYFDRFIGATSPWSSFIYFYGLGWAVYIFFSFNLMRIKGIDWSSRLSRFWFILVTFGLAFFCVAHGFWTYIAIHTPYKGM